MTEKRKITPEDISEATVAPPKNDKLSKDEASFFHEEKMQKASLGWVGKVWGSRSEKPGNIAAIVALIILIFLGWLLYYGTTSDEGFSSVEETFALLSSTLTLILGYLFGSSSNN